MHSRRKSTLALLFACAFLSNCVVATAARADDVGDSRRHQEWVDVKTADGRTVRTFVVYPEVDKPVPAVLVIHENRGLNDWARSVADRLAEAGYVALAPDLLSGMGPAGGGADSFESADDARAALYRLTDERVQQDLDAVAEYAKKLTAVNGKIAVAGFCWGGGQSFAYAAHSPGLAAAFVFYGRAPDEARLKAIQCPVYGFYGGNDFRITGETPKVADAMKQAGKSYEPVAYEGAGHGFMRSGEAADARPDDKQGRDQAWERWKRLLSEL